jgi:biotin carboxylase
MQSSKQHVLVVGGRDHTLVKLDQMDIEYSMIQVPDLVTEKQLHESRRYLVMDYTCIDEVVAVARTWHAIDRFDAIVSFAEHGMHAASVCAIELGLPGANLSAVIHTRDKIKMRALLASHGVATVAYQPCDTIEEAAEFLSRLGKPIILKPYAGGGSAGVARVAEPGELAAAWAWARASTQERILAEEFIEGPEFSVESVSAHGRHEVAMITEKLTTGAPHFIELGHQVPPRLDEDTQAQVRSMVVRFLELIDQQVSPAHTEIRLTPQGPKIIESQTRIGGDQIWEMCEMVSGIDQMSETIANLVGRPAPQRTPRAPAAAIRFFALENVRVDAVDGVDLAKASPGVVRVNCTLKPGAELGPLKWSESRQGYVLCTGDDVHAAIANAEHALGQVRVDNSPLAQAA